jgi:non-ribosomal peptide synthetase component F
MTLMSAFNVLLYRTSNQTDLIVATGIANRKWVEIESLIGFFVNTLMLRVDLSGSPTFREVLERVRKVTLEAYAHQDVPLEKLVQELQIKRDPSRHPITQIALTLHNSPVPVLELSGLSMEPLEVDLGTAKFDLELFISEANDSLNCRLEYNADLFDAAGAARILRQFETLLESIAAQPGARISTLELRSEREKMQQKEEEENNRLKLRKAKRRTIVLEPAALVETSYLDNSDTRPLVVQPAVRDVNLAAWYVENRAFIEKELLTHGAILFRGFHIGSASEFERIAMSYSPDLLEYGERSTPRSSVVG